MRSLTGNLLYPAQSWQCELSSSPYFVSELMQPVSVIRWVLRQLNGRTSTGARQAMAALRPQKCCFVRASQKLGQTRRSPILHSFEKLGNVFVCPQLFPRRRGEGGSQVETAVLIFRKFA